MTPHYEEKTEKEPLFSQDVSFSNYVQYQYKCGICGTQSQFFEYLPDNYSTDKN
jgi:hypothetical protein